MSNFKSVNELVQSGLSFSKTKYSSGIDEFGKLNMEFIPGQVILMGARPSIGRTLFKLYNNIKPI